jgi:multidrug resistance efflux pump
MRLGDANSKPLSTVQLRILLVVAAVIGIIIITSLYSHLAYRQLRAFVVGNTIGLASRVEGRIDDILLKENEPYTAGTVLVRLSNEGLRAEVASTEAQIEEIQRSLALERSAQGLERRRYDLQTAEADAESRLASARAGAEAIDHVLADLEKRRDAARERIAQAEALYAAEAMTAAELDQNRRECLSAMREYENAVSERRTHLAETNRQSRVLELVRKRLENLESDQTGLISELEIDLANRQGELRRLRAQLGELDIVAERDGIVSRVLRRPGEFVPAGETVLKVMTTDDVWVEAYLPASEKQRVQVGDVVEVRSRDHSGTTLTGRVDRILPVLQPLPHSNGALGNGQNFAVLVVVFEDSDSARYALSPAQQVSARVRRRWRVFGGLEATAHEVAPAAEQSAAGTDD